MENERQKYQKILNKLEAGVTEYNNKNVDLVNQYIAAKDNTLKQHDLSIEYNKNVLEIKRFNRRIVLLKNQCPCSL